ncbi:MAG: Transcriptional activator protein CopR [Steroidobacteraceae bacterium]|nr:Transcriptional activator protein CopR [Steroidobacteraceae bacterium]
MRLLLVEDDVDAAEYVLRGLREAGYTVDHARDGRDGLFKATESRYDLVIADRMLPFLDGLSLVAVLRRNGNQVPVLILSALGSVDDRVAGLKAGGDDYLTKPFSFSELLARIEVRLRRSQAPPDSARLVAGDLEMDLLSRQVTRGGRRIELTAKEFQLLEVLLRRAGQVVTRTMLLEEVWDFNFDPHTNVVDVHVSRLRRAVDRDFERPLIHTVRGAGYMLRAA